MIAEKYVELSHGKTRYLEAGSGDPVILLHGVDFAAGGDRWQFVMEPLAQRFRAIAPDFLGWGLGDRFQGEYSFAYLVDFVRELQDALGIESSHIVGHSMGGWVATLFGYESPQRVRKLVLVAAGGTAARTLRTMTEFQPPSRDDIRDMLKRTVKVDTDIEALVDMNFKKTQVPGAIEAYRRILSHMNDAANRQRYSTVRRLPHIKVPTLIVWGEQDEVNALEMAHTLNQGIPDSKLVVLPDTAHFIPTERPKELSQALIDFLS
ncbi:MAG TPA: alpha/beta fold hydrolase [Chloroflexota bacterium]|nr:alpha/beta fold hydrolase [Chloroflexota bacterium]